MTIIYMASNCMVQTEENVIHIYLYLRDNTQYVVTYCKLILRQFRFFFYFFFSFFFSYSLFLRSKSIGHLHFSFLLRIIYLTFIPQLLYWYAMYNLSYTRSAILNRRTLDNILRTDQHNIHKIFFNNVTLCGRYPYIH